MTTHADNSPYLDRAGTVREVLWLVVTGIAIILFSTAGLARMMGWGPGGPGDSGDVLVLDRTAPVLMASKARAKARCVECGEIVSFREIERHDEDTGFGTAGEATASDADEIQANSIRSYEITVRMADGSSRVIDYANPAKWRAGERVLVIDGADPSHP